MSVFVFVVKEAFDSPCLPQNYKDEIEISELVEFCNKRFTEFFVFTAKRELDELETDMTSRFHSDQFLTKLWKEKLLRDKQTTAGTTGAYSKAS